VRVACATFYLVIGVVHQAAADAVIGPPYEDASTSTYGTGVAQAERLSGHVSGNAHADCGAPSGGGIAYVVAVHHLDSPMSSVTYTMTLQINAISVEEISGDIIYGDPYVYAGAYAWLSIATRAPLEKYLYPTWNAGDEVTLSASLEASTGEPLVGDITLEAGIGFSASVSGCGGTRVPPRRSAAASVDATVAQFAVATRAIAITSGPSGVVNSSSASFSFASSTPNSTFECRRDGSTFEACTSPRTYSELADGSHAFEVRGIDEAGNPDDSPASRSWTIDTAAPDTSITGGPTGSVSSRSATFSFSKTEEGSFECRLDGGSFATCWWTATYSGLADGLHTFAVRAIDEAGNVDTSPASRTWTVDTTAPETSITDGAAGTVSSRSATFTFSSGEPATFECRLDGNSFSTCNSPASYSGLSDGTHTFEVRAADEAGNVDSTPAARTWTVDAVAPETTITGGPSGPVSSTSASFTFTSTDAASFECRLDGASFAACTSPTSYSGLAQGSHEFEVRAKDGVGNVDASPALRDWWVDTVAPDTTITWGPSGTVDSSTASFHFTASEGGATFECRLDGGSMTACATPRLYDGLAEGPHVFEVRAVDAAGNVDPTPASRSWIIDLPPETTIVSGPPGATTATSATFEFTASEAGSTFACQLDGAAYAPCVSPKTYSGLSETTHIFSVRATTGPTDPSPASWVWSVDLTPPETWITSGPAAQTSSRTAALSFTSTDAGSMFACRLDGGGFSACTTPKTYAGLADGSHTFEVRATDPAGNTDPTPATRTWSVVAPPDTTITAGPSGAVASASASFSFTTSEAGATFACSLDNGSFTSCVTPKSYSSLADGSHTFRVRAIDSAGNVDPTPASRTWTADTSKPIVLFQRPTRGIWAMDTRIASFPATIVIGSVTVEAQAYDSQSDLASFEFQVDGTSVASSVNYDAATKTYSFLYRPLLPGRHTIQATAVNGAGLPNVATMQIFTV
jgi:hypothetical protein